MVIVINNVEKSIDYLGLISIKNVINNRLCIIR